jgi:hypothetical protein
MSESGLFGACPFPNPMEAICLLILYVSHFQHTVNALSKFQLLCCWEWLTCAALHGLLFICAC